jgi:hypothetical protein
MRTIFALVLAMSAGIIRSSGIDQSNDNTVDVVNRFRGKIKAYQDLLEDDFLVQCRKPAAAVRLKPQVLLQQKSISNRCYILKLRSSTDGSEVDRVAEFLQKLDARIDGTIRDLLKAHVVCFKKPAAPIQLLRSIKCVDIIEQDQRIRVKQWANDRVSSKLVEKSGVPFTKNDLGRVNVYVVDTGIWTQHSEFNGRARIGYSIFDGRYGDDCNGHGTQVASLIGGQKLGIAPGVNLIGVQAMDCDGSGTIANMLKALDWIKGNAEKPAIVNMSFNGAKSTILDQAVDDLIASGITVVAAAGNSGDDACEASPSDSSKAIIVGATDVEDRRAEFSNYGKCITIFAPGCNIIAATVPFTPKSMFSPAPGKFVDKSLLGFCQKHPEDRYVVTSGTSFAAPFVTGSIALLLARNSSLTPFELRERILSGSLRNVLRADTLNNSPNILLQLPY